MLWLALHLRTLPLDALLAGAPPDEAAAAPRCVVEQRCVVLACAQAAAAGVWPGMSAATAASLRPGLQVLPRDAPREAALVQRLTLALARYTPHLVPQAEGVLLEVAGSLRLFGGARALWRAVRATAHDSGVVQARIAAAPTATAAGLLARVAPVRPPGGDRGAGLAQRTQRALDALPLAPALAALQMPPRLAELLHGIGCRTLADVRALPRSGLQRRGGMALQHALDRAYGDAPDPQPWFEPPQHFELGLELLQRADNAQTLVFAAERLVPPLAGWLAQQWRAAVRVSLHLHHERSPRRAPQPDTVVRIELGQPSRDAAQILLLLRERLLRTALPAPAYAITLRLDEAVSHAGREAGLWRDTAQAGDDHRALLDRLAARLGADRVQRPVLRADHRPEHAMAFEPATSPRAEPGQARTPRILGPSKGRAEPIPSARAEPTPSVRAEPVEAPARAARPLDKLRPFDRLRMHGPFDRPRANGGEGIMRGTELAGWPVASAPRPTWLLPEPLRLQEQGGRPLHGGAPLALRSRAERIEAGWFDGALVSRDYHLAEGRDHRLRWVFCERRGGVSSWYLHGLFG